MDNQHGVYTTQLFNLYQSVLGKKFETFPQFQCLKGTRHYYEEKKTQKRDILQNRLRGIYLLYIWRQIRLYLLKSQDFKFRLAYTC